MDGVAELATRQRRALILSVSSPPSRHNRVVHLVLGAAALLSHAASRLRLEASGLESAPGASHLKSKVKGQRCPALERRSRSFVNNSEQFVADLVDGFAERSIEHLRVHVQRRVDVGVTHQLRHDFAWQSLCSCDHEESTCGGTSTMSLDAAGECALTNAVSPQSLKQGYQAADVAAAEVLILAVRAKPE